MNHIIGEYVRGDVTTNSMESVFSLFKRGVIGQFHKLSAKHLHRYLAEFEYRFNRRNDADVFIETVRRLCGFKPLRFAELTSDPEPASVGSFLGAFFACISEVFCGGFSASYEVLRRIVLCRPSCAECSTLGIGNAVGSKNALMAA